MSYDYTVLAGTQGMRNHLKKDRLFEIAEHRRLPVVLFAEGGGGRPGDVDMPIVAGLDCRAFHLFARLSGARAARRDRLRLLLRRQRRAARLLRCRDRDRGLEHRDGRSGDDRGRRARRVRARATSVRSTSSTPNGVVDLRVQDDAAAVSAAKRYLTLLPRVGRVQHGHRSRPDQTAPARSDPDQPQAHLRRPRGDRRAVRRGLRARAAPRFRARDRHRARARRRPPARRDRQRPDPPRRRDRRPRRRQGGPLHAAVRRASACRCCSCATRRASWSARRPSAPPPSGTSAACS